MATKTKTRTQNATSQARQPQKVEVQDLEEADTDRIGTLSSVLGGGEVEVGAPEEVIPESIRKQIDTVVVRVNEDVEDMSWVGGGRRLRFTFKQGHVYRVPVPIAIELERIGKVWH